MYLASDAADAVILIDTVALAAYGTRARCNFSIR